MPPAGPPHTAILPPTHSPRRRDFSVARGSPRARVIVRHTVDVVSLGVADEAVPRPRGRRCVLSHKWWGRDEGTIRPDTAWRYHAQCV